MALPPPWRPPEIRPDGRDAAGRPRARIDGVPARLLSAGPRTCRWTTGPGHRLVLDGPAHAPRLRISRDAGKGAPEILLRAPFRPDLPDGGLADALAAACAAAPRGALLAALLALHPAEIPSGLRLHLHDTRTFSVAGRVLLEDAAPLQGAARWLGPAAAPLLSPWRLAAAALETAAADPPASAHARLALRADAERLLPPRLRAQVLGWI